MEEPYKQNLIDITICHGDKLINVQDSICVCCYNASFNEIVSFKVKIDLICVADEINLFILVGIPLLSLLF